MTVKKGSDWGVEGSPSSEVSLVVRDSDFFSALHAGRREFVVGGGDLGRTLGASVPHDGCSFRRVTCDLVEIVVEDPMVGSRQLLAASHCLIRSRVRSGGLWAGPVTAVCNAQYMRNRNIVPRGHPNDGRVEILSFDASLSPRNRIEVLRRMRTGDHVPHPMIKLRQASERVVIDVSGVVFVDGVRIGFHRLLSVTPMPDAAVLWIPYHTAQT